MDVEANGVDVGEGIWLIQAAGGRDTDRLDAREMALEAGRARSAAAPRRWRVLRRRLRPIARRARAEVG